MFWYLIRHHGPTTHPEGLRVPCVCLLCNNHREVTATDLQGCSETPLIVLCLSDSRDNSRQLRELSRCTRGYGTVSGTHALFAAAIGSCSQTRRANQYRHHGEVMFSICSFVSRISKNQLNLVQIWIMGGHAIELVCSFDSQWFWLPNSQLNQVETKPCPN